MYNKILFIFLLSTFFFTIIDSRTAQEWKSRIIYEIVTDRFAKTNGDTAPCSNFGDYCGGTFKGIEKNLDYIQGMGFNAIWISPVQANIPGGYHGYWYSNFYKINESFGTEQDLRDLIEACHERDIWIIVDIVANHVGYLQRENIRDARLNDYSSNVPFNDPSYFNALVDSCADAEKKYPGNQDVIETCWLAYLPDLNQNNPFVRKTLIEWIAWFVKDYHFDGIRLDAIRHVSPTFWSEFTKASGVFSIGESFLFSVAENAAYLKGAMDSMLNFPFNSVIYHTFIKNLSMKQISDYYDEAFKVWPDIAVLGNFVGNHDIARYLSYYSLDKAGLKAALAFTVFTVGIPTIYYGDEQAFDGGDDPLNREPLWTSMNTESDGYQFLRIINAFRRKVKLHELDQVQRVYDDDFYSFTRGDYFFAFTNSPNPQTREISDHPYAEGMKLCSLFEAKECVTVEDGKFRVTLSNKEVKVLVPNNGEDSESLKVYKVLENVKIGLAKSVSSGLNGLLSERSCSHDIIL